MPYSVLAASLCLLASLGVDNATAATPTAADSLRAELHVAQTFLTPGSPIELRFTLVNTSADPTDISLRHRPDHDAGITLPPEILFGTADEPAIIVTAVDRSPIEVMPPTADHSPADSADADPTTVRLAGNATLGTLLDLTDFYRMARYPGDYTVTWQPLGGQAGIASVSFRVEPRREAILVTDHGKLTFELDYDGAPLNVHNFLELAEDGFYNGTILHRIIPGFVIQGGCPNGNGSGIRPDGKLVPAEFHKAPVDVGTLLASRKGSDPNSASCQFFIALARLEHLDDQYTVIGQATDVESMRTLQALAAVRTTDRGRPIAPITIRSINLVEDSSRRVHDLGTRSTAPRAHSEHPTTQPAE